MSDCNGRGICIKQCYCICYEDERHEIPLEICSCGHRNHDLLINDTLENEVYCQKNCPHKCQLVECYNFKLCGQKLPQWVLDCDRGMCNYCAVMFGKIKFLDEKDDCPICIENRDMILINCGKHKICLDCWKQMSKTTDRSITLACPLCRESIWK